MQIYVHIPFCKQKCRYCDFNSFPCCDDTAISDYLNGLNAEISLCGKQYGSEIIDSVYIGGGTPSILNEECIVSICDTLKKSFDLSHVKEWTIECNPESITKEKLALYKGLGINRLSIGVQSLDDENLRAVGRIHNAQTALEKLALANEYFDNLSCDLIVGLPYDTPESVEKEIRTLAPLVDHMSVYELILEEGTPLYNDVQKGDIRLCDDDEVQNIFDKAIGVLKECGFDRYEVSNFAKDDKKSLHNYGYWTREEYFGFGAGAHSFVKLTGANGAEETRYSNFCNITDYLSAVNNAENYTEILRDEREILSEKDIYNEQIILGLRTVKGVKSNLLHIPNHLKDFFEKDGEYTHLTSNGIAVMNSVLTELLDF